MKQWIINRVTQTIWDRTGLGSVTTTRTVWNKSSQSRWWIREVTYPGHGLWFQLKDFLTVYFSPGSFQIITKFMIFLGTGHWPFRGIHFTFCIIRYTEHFPRCLFRVGHKHDLHRSTSTTLEWQQRVSSIPVVTTNVLFLSNNNLEFVTAPTVSTIRVPSPGSVCQIAPKSSKKRTAFTPWTDHLTIIQTCPLINLNLFNGRLASTNALTSNIVVLQVMPSKNRKARQERSSTRNVLRWWLEKSCSASFDLFGRQCAWLRLLLHRERHQPSRRHHRTLLYHSPLADNVVGVDRPLTP